MENTNEKETLNTENDTEKETRDEEREAEKTEVADEKNDKKEKHAKKEISELKAKNEKLESDLAALNDKYTRMIAEYDNFRKRAAKEREGTYSDACADVLTQLLGVKDNLELAVKFADKEKFAEGVVMTLTKFSEALTKLGVEEFGCRGDNFDPNLHNAVMHEQDESLGENQIAEVLLKGYKKGDKVIRYAMVKVAN